MPKSKFVCLTVLRKSNKSLKHSEESFDRLIKSLTFNKQLGLTFPFYSWLFCACVSVSSFLPSLPAFALASLSSIIEELSIVNNTKNTIHLRTRFSLNHRVIPANTSSELKDDPNTFRLVCFEISSFDKIYFLGDSLFPNCY